MNIRVLYTVLLLDQWSIVSVVDPIDNWPPGWGSKVSWLPLFSSFFASCAREKKVTNHDVSLVNKVKEKRQNERSKNAAVETKGCEKKDDELLTELQPQAVHQMRDKFRQKKTVTEVLSTDKNKNWMKIEEEAKDVQDDCSLCSFQNESLYFSYCYMFLSFLFVSFFVFSTLIPCVLFCNSVLLVLFFLFRFRVHWNRWWWWPRAFISASTSFFTLDSYSRTVLDWLPDDSKVISSFGILRSGSGEARNKEEEVPSSQNIWWQTFLKDVFDSLRFSIFISPCSLASFYRFWCLLPAS